MTAASTAKRFSPLQILLVIFAALFFISSIRAICPRPENLYPGLFLGNIDLPAASGVTVKLVYMPTRVQAGKDYRIRTLLTGADSVFTASEFAEQYFLRVRFTSNTLPDHPAYDVPFAIDYKSLTTELALNDWIDAWCLFKPEITLYQGTVRMELVHKQTGKCEAYHERDFSSAQPVHLKEKWEQWANEILPEDKVLYSLAAFLILLSCFLHFSFPVALVGATPILFALGYMGKLHCPLKTFQTAFILVIAIYVLLEWEKRRGAIHEVWGSLQSWQARLEKWEAVFLKIFLCAGILVFGSSVFVGFENFLWGPFEERDYLLACEVAKLQFFPALGPQLANGGQSPGGFIYLFMGFFVALWNDPTVLAILNVVLYFLGIWVLYRFLKAEYGDRIAALSTVFLLASPVVVAYSLWPIHPSMTFAFNIFLFVSLYHLFIKRKAIHFVWSALLLAMLIQLHFSYFLLIPAFIGMAYARRGEIGWKYGVAGFFFFIILFLPYFLYEITHGWANAQLMMSAPRHLETYPVVHRFANPMVIQMNFKWLFMGKERLNHLLTTLAWGASAMGLVYTLRRLDDIRYRFLIIWYGIPIFILCLMGIGQNLRHFVIIVPLIFLWPSLGMNALIARFPAIGRLGLIFVLTLLAASMIRLPQETAEIGRRYIREWSRPFGERTAIAQSMAEAGISPAMYREKVFWFWVGWTMTPELYDRVWKKYGNEAASKGYQEKEGFLVLDTEYWPFMLKHMELKKLADLSSGVKISQYTFKTPHRFLSNTRNVTFLNREEEELEYSHYSEGVHLLQDENVKDKRFMRAVISFLNGKIMIKTEMTMKVLPSGGTLCDWRVVSSHLSGYYQEIKQIRRPYLEFLSASGEVLKREPIAYNVLGSLLEKTPVSGQFEINEKPEAIRLRFGHEGIFDQASMKSPDRTPWQEWIGGSNDF